MLKAAQQLSVWGYVRGRAEQLADTVNRLGPFPLKASEEVHRHIYCTNYDGCLNFAALHRWQSFSCVDCRRVQGRQFEE